MLACNYMGNYGGGFIDEIGVAFNTNICLHIFDSVDR